jgi:tRNA-modifying protein YgfZ
MSDLAWIAPEHPDVVWFSGADSLRFLNDIISQELGDMEPGQVRRSFLLEPQGKLRFLLWVVRDDDRIGLVTDPERGGELAEALGRYRIRVDVEIEEEAGEVWLVIGEWEGYDVSWPGVERRLVIGERPQLGETGDEARYEALRIRAGQPRWGVDVDDATIPHESGLVPSSVNFDSFLMLQGRYTAPGEHRKGQGGGANTQRPPFITESGPVRRPTSSVGSPGTTTRSA